MSATLEDEAKTKKTQFEKIKAIFSFLRKLLTKVNDWLFPSANEKKIIIPNSSDDRRAASAIDEMPSDRQNSYGRIARKLLPSEGSKKEIADRDARKNSLKELNNQIAEWNKQKKSYKEQFNLPTEPATISTTDKQKTLSIIKDIQDMILFRKKIKDIRKPSSSSPRPQ